MAFKRKTRLYEPWGYREENDYQSTESIHRDDLEKFFVDTSYSRDDNKIYFTNLDEKIVASIDVSEFIKSDSIIEKTEYNDGILTITFTNGDVITIDLTELLDENEFKDGLVVDGHVVKVLIDPESEPYISVSENGVKVSGIDAAIKVETDRAEAEEQRIEEKLDEEIARAKAEEERIDDKLDEEIARAKAEEERIDDKLDEEIVRATRTEQGLNHRIDLVNDELDSEESRALATEQELRNLINGESSEREAADAELQRAINNLVSTKFDDANYDDSAKAINFYADGNVVASIDATPFLTGGMIEEAYFDPDTRELVIVWNTSSGQQETRIPLSDIFNPDDYYTKNEVDELLENANSAITEVESTLEEKIARLRESLNSEITRAENAETTLEEKIALLRESLNGEIERATAKEEELEGADVASGFVDENATISVTKNNGSVITFSSAEQISLEAGEF